MSENGHKEIYNKLSKLDERGIRNEQKIDAIDERLDKVEAKVDKVCDDVYTIKANELPHIEQRLDDRAGIVWYAKWAAAIAGISVSTHLVVSNWYYIIRAVYDFLHVFFG